MTIPSSRHGLLLVDKPVGPTSHDMVDRVRRVVGTRQVGHAGTLDPFASGLLVMCIGWATRLSEYLVGLPKSYEAVACLETSTDTEDLTGEVIARSEGWRDLSVEDVESALNSFRGDYEQRPSAFSAKKQGGEAAYKKARRGEAVELPPVTIRIHSIELVAVDLPRVEFRVHCSSGTYIRALARDLGERLGVEGHLSALRRTEIGNLTVEKATRLEALEGFGIPPQSWLTPLEGVSHLPRVDVTVEEFERIRHGQPLYYPEGSLRQGDPVRLAYQQELVAIAIPEGDRLRPRKVFSGD